MKPAVHNASARQNSGEPSPVPGLRGGRNDRVRKPGLTEVDGEIAELVNRSTHDLRLAWRKWHRTGPPLGLSRDLLIRTVANQLQERAHGGPSAALRRRLRTLAGELERGASSVNSGILPKTGTILLRAWRGQTHTVLASEDGFEYAGQRYRSMTVIAERITGAHWSGPGFFGLTRVGRGSSPAEASQ